MNLDDIIQKEFDEYCIQTKNPFENKDYFIGLLDNNLLDIRAYLDDIEELYQKRRLYRKWSQVVDGKKRNFSVPNPIFFEFINLYITPLIKKIKAYGKAHGGEIGWSTRKSLEQHLPIGTCFSFDLEDAFNNVNIRHVFQFFYKNFENRYLAGFLSFILTTINDDKRILPQGAPHSMALYNRILYELDFQLDYNCKAKGLNYTRWVDDMTISSSNSLEMGEFWGVIKLAEKYFPVSKCKIFFQSMPDKIYLLGHTIQQNKVSKNSKEERERNKALPIDYNYHFNIKSSYREW